MLCVSFLINVTDAGLITILKKKCILSFELVLKHSWKGFYILYTLYIYIYIYIGWQIYIFIYTHIYTNIYIYIHNVWIYMYIHIRISNRYYDWAVLD